MRKIAGILISLFIGIIAVIIFSKFIPYNMDEFSMYHVLSCHYYKNNLLNEFQEGCKYYDLNLLNTGLILPMREYHYMGSITSLYYYPLFLLWKSPVSARFVGIIFLIIQSLVLSQIFKIRFEYILLGLAIFFQYFYMHIADTGVVGFQITCFFVIYYLIIKWLEDTKIMYLISTAIIIFLALWAKLTFVWFFPGLGILFIMHVLENPKNIFMCNKLKKILIHLAVFSILLFALFCTLFFSTCPTYYDRPYLGQLTRGSGLHPLSKIFSTDIGDINVFKSFINPMRATEKTGYASAVQYHQDKPDFLTYFFDIFLYLSVPLLCIFAFLITASKKMIGKSLIMYFCFIITSIVILMTKNASLMHHAILAFPFLILSFLSIINVLKENSKKVIARKVLFVWCLVFILLNMHFFNMFINQTIQFNQQKQLDFSPNYINKFLNDAYLSENYFYVVVDWGMYYYQALYGKKSQSVLYVPYLDEKKKVERLYEMSKDHNRKLLFIYAEGKSRDYINKSFSVQPCNLNEENAKWKILIEEDENPANKCFKP